MQLLNLELDILAYNSSAISNDPSDSLRISNTNVSGQSITDVYRQVMALPSGGSLQAITLPANPSSYLIIFGDQNLTMQLNGSVTNITLQPPVAGVKVPLFLLLGPVTALSLQTTASVNANVDIWIMQ